MARSVGDTRAGSANANGGNTVADDSAEVLAAIVAAINADPLTPEERRQRMAESLARCNALRERLLEEMGEPLPAGWGARMIREGRP